jgi:hypothetical protein
MSTTTTSTNSTTSTKSVTFSLALSTSFSFPRVEAIDIESVYYQDEDYKRFRQESWLEKMRLASAEARKRAIKASDADQLYKDSKRRDAMLNYGKNSRAKVQQRGIALAA